MAAWGSEKASISLGPGPVPKFDILVILFRSQAWKSVFIALRISGRPSSPPYVYEYALCAKKSATATLYTKTRSSPFFSYSFRLRPCNVVLKDNFTLLGIKSACRVACATVLPDKRSKTSSPGWKYLSRSELERLKTKCVPLTTEANPCSFHKNIR